MALRAMEMDAASEVDDIPVRIIKLLDLLPVFTEFSTVPDVLELTTLFAEVIRCIMKVCKISHQRCHQLCWSTSAKRSIHSAGRQLHG